MMNQSRHYNETVKQTIAKALGLALVCLLAGCSKTPPIPEKRYPMQGEIVTLEPRTKAAIIRAGKVGDWMEPMTMEYPIEPASEFAQLKIGDHIQATVVVQGYKYYATGIQVVPAPAAK